jgi:YARHG domain-containing protein
MKSQLKLFLIISISVCFMGCSNADETDDSKTKASEKITLVEEVKPKEFKFTKEQLSLVEEVLNFDENTFVKSENLNVNGEKFEYSAVIIDVEMLNLIGSINHSQSSIFKFASYNQEVMEFDLGDSIEVSGSVKIDQTHHPILEQPLPEVNLIIQATINTSRLQSSPYSYSGYERTTYDFDFEEPLIVNLNQPRIYSKDELYLKARIRAFTKADLEGFTSEELSYLRNEIFARHGHAFKTDKMKSYFNEKEWYKAIYGDATPFLNDLETNNVILIKSLES